MANPCGAPWEFEDSNDEFAEDEAGAVQQAVRGIDAALGKLIATLAPEDTILIASDHGFQAKPDADEVWITGVEDAFDAHDLDTERMASASLERSVPRRSGSHRGRSRRATRPSRSCAPCLSRTARSTASRY